MVVWNRLIRFESSTGEILSGEPIIDDGKDIDQVVANGQLKARVLSGDDVFSDLAVLTEGIKEVKTLLGPLVPSQVPLIRCIGLNYMKHIQEGNRKPPPYPSLFIKPSDCVADAGATIRIPKLAQDEQCDYEGELVSASSLQCGSL